MMCLSRSACLTWIVAAIWLSPAQATTPPIDCRAAKSVVDRTICQSAEFVAMDREIAALYDRGLADFEPADRHRLAQSQITFLRRRSGCAWAAHHSAHPGVAVGECIRSAMEDRLNGLRRVVERGGYGR